MATVTLFVPTDLGALPIAATSYSQYHYTSGVDQVELDFAGPASSVLFIGEFTDEEGYIGGSVTDAYFDTPDPGTAVNFSITRLSFDFDVDYQSNVLHAGNVAQLVRDMLSGKDTVIGTPGADGLYGWDGNDTLEGRAGGDVLNGGIGNDTASYASAPAGVVANLAAPGYNTGDAAGDTYVSIENLTGSAFNDFLYGDGGVNRFKGGAGKDVMAGLGGGDVFDGGAGKDTVSYDSSFAVKASLLKPAINSGDATGDSYISIENIDGSSFNDQLFGDNANNVVRGSSYPDLMSGNDKLSGLGGRDSLFGFDGKDVLTGGLGRDKLTGGSGADRFDFNEVEESPAGSGRDIITDFDADEGDRIDLTDIDARTGGGNQAFDFIGTSKFHGVKGELRYAKSGSNVVVQGDVDGDGAADLEILVENTASLSANAFLL